jgi:hypothetical protein
VGKKIKDDIKTIGSDDKREEEAIGHYCEALGLARAIVSLKRLATIYNCYKSDRALKGQAYRI